MVPTYNVLGALDGVRKALVEDRADAEFARAADLFLAVFRGEAMARGLGDWDLLALLASFEGFLVADPDLSVDFAAACKTVRDLLTLHRHAQARLN